VASHRIGGNKAVKIPPFQPRSSIGKHKTVDYSTQEGAHRLGSIAREAWAKAGHDVPFVVEKFTTSGSESRFTPRFPTLVNGLPVE